MAATTLGFGLLLGWADWRSRRQHDLAAMSWRHTLAIGLAQALALVPGTSRSGITMTAALMLGYTREAAARFSFLMSIPVILAASSLMSLELVISPVTIDLGAYAACFWCVFCQCMGLYCVVYADH